ncbi:ORF020L [Infectious spleen and kidney necrosis virus]|uniref:ORF020L n=2 Tax=Infectious spleen and kidney necrosis virus TaxID=180170 RepID=Q8QUU0_ISKNN|nr:ORF020L [Infectious spleen and kidney necrosis virus]AAL98744.1 ORF020L [Infectious spleen and kidney necrosis virus]APR73276.1 ORF020L [Infectious spleen and kidney necrosis virus]APR73279.1 ORF020L [Infectious spleen and kidney necrosis virus]APR73282.1 ORF020L [Infectious spleen and kidney necrosis virus]WHE27004.1 hypothetical protein [Infectious spleen and kidney necrosis virus]
MCAMASCSTLPESRQSCPSATFSCSLTELHDRVTSFFGTSAGGTSAACGTAVVGDDSAIVFI